MYLLRPQNHLVWMVYMSVRRLLVDVLQDIYSRHVIPPGQVELLAGLKIVLWEYMVLNHEHSDLWREEDT